MNTLDFVEAYLASLDELTFAAEFDHDGIHFKVEGSDEDAEWPKVTMTISPHDDSVMAEYRELAFDFIQSIFSEVTNNDVCQTLVRETYDLPASTLTYVSTVEDYLT